MSLHQQQKLTLTLNDNDDPAIRQRNWQKLQSDSDNRLSNIPWTWRSHEPLTTVTTAELTTGNYYPFPESWNSPEEPLDRIYTSDNWPTQCKGVLFQKEHRWTSITIDFFFSFWFASATTVVDFGVRLETEAGDIEFDMALDVSLNSFADHQHLAISSGPIDDANGGLFGGQVGIIPVVRGSQGSGTPALATFRQDINDYMQVRCIEHPPVPYIRVV